MQRQSVTQAYLGDFVLGAIDGTITTFAIIAGIVGAGFEGGVAIALILGFANVLADGFSMGASNYLKAKSDKDTGGVSSTSPLGAATITFVAFVSIGSLPMAPFVGSALSSSSQSLDFIFTISCFITALCFIGTGLLRAKITGGSYLRSTFETLAIGSVAALLAFYSGYGLALLLGVS